jgi:hypothetical protein
MNRGVGFTLPELVALDRYPAADRWGVFYGQSAALVRALLARGTAPQLLACIKQTPRGAMSLVLRTDYRLQSWGDIQSTAGVPIAWRGHSIGQPATVAN